MPFLTVVICLAVVGLLAIAASLKAISARLDPAKPLHAFGGFPRADAYVASISLLSDVERAFLCVLETAAPPTSRIYVQVALTALIAPRRGISIPQHDIDRIARDVVDFVLCDQSTKPLAVIDLDDSSPDRSNRTLQDDLLEMILLDVGLPFLRIRAADDYDIPALRTELSKAAAVR